MLFPLRLNELSAARGKFNLSTVIPFFFFHILSTTRYRQLNIVRRIVNKQSSSVGKFNTDFFHTMTHNFGDYSTFEQFSCSFSFLL